MTNTTFIIAPPYHVQSSAAELRSGFPYFSYHDCVSALWADKWRALCQHGIYPFTDTNVKDFDPIFAALVKVSDDSSDILYQPDEYAKPFLPVAENLVALAGEAERQGDTAKARELYLRAAAVYRIGRFPINRSPLSQKAWEKGKEAYVKGGGNISARRVFRLTCRSSTRRPLWATAMRRSRRICECRRGLGPKTAGLCFCSSAVWMPIRPITLRAPRPTLIGDSQPLSSRYREPATARRLPTTPVLPTAS